MEDAGAQVREQRCVVIAGASGFIGRRLIARLAGDWKIIGLTRDAVRARARHRDLDVEWRDCDLFSLSDAEAAFAGATHAYYLVHSMAPSARLSQASFADLDLILADNFARAAARAGAEQIVYLGGLVPDRPRSTLSAHLRSRLEVEEQLAAHGVPVTALRAGLVLGQGGSSFQMLRKLVERLPVMALPAWTQTPTTPIALDDCVELLARSLGDPATYGRHGDIGCAETLTYAQMIRSCAEGMGLRRAFVRIPLLSPGLSRAWVSLITGAPRELVAPLVASLECEMVADKLELQRHLGVEPLGFDEALARALTSEVQPEGESPATQAEPARRRGRARARRPRLDRAPKDVRSVQRLSNPEGRSMRWVALEYARWLPRFMWPLITVDVDDEGSLVFRLALLRLTLLKLSLQADRSLAERDLYYITGGLLADLSHSLRGRLEFRRVLGGETLLAAIHDFTPRLPWLLYRFTQAVAHLIVMRAFGRHLAAPRGYLGAAREPARLPPARVAELGPARRVQANSAQRGP